MPLLAGLLLAPSSARAECGDYVTTRLSHDVMTSPHEPQAAASQLPLTMPRPHKPCNGPRCSHAPVAPPAPAPAVPRPTSQEWGCVLHGLSVAPLDPTALLPEHHVRHPVRLASAIFHPPRIAS